MVIKDILKNHFNLTENLFNMLLFKDPSKLKVIKTIQTQNNDWVNSLCILKDKRLVSCGHDGLIIVYNKSYQPQIQIRRAHDNLICSLYVLRNGQLLSLSYDIKVWRISENDYELIHTLIGHSDTVFKVVELEDGKLCSCSLDKRIKIWDSNTYQSITTLQTHSSYVCSLVEMNDYIISIGYEKKDGLRIWNKLTYESVKKIKNVYCFWGNALEKLNNNTVVIGGENELFVVDIPSSKVNQLYDDTLGFINCLKVIRNDLVLFGSDSGEICSYNPLSNQIISKIKAHNGKIMCLIENEDDQLISCSSDKTINIYG